MQNYWQNLLASRACKPWIWILREKLKMSKTVYTAREIINTKLFLSMLGIHDYKKAFGASLVLTIHSLQLPVGIYWLKGENGSGKTTLIKSIAGLLPFEGSIGVHKLDIRRQRRPYVKIVAYAEAEPLYPSFLTGEDLIRFYLSTKGGDYKNVLQLARLFCIDKSLHHKIGSYSSGMIKKLSLILAFVGNPKLILLDEPFITLDAEAVQVMHNLILESFAKNISFIITSHEALPFEKDVHSLTIQNKTILL